MAIDFLSDNMRVELTGVEVWQALSNVGVDPDVIHVADKRYVCPQYDSIIGAFNLALTMQRAHSVRAWSSEVWDCDDFAMFAASHAKLAHRLTIGENGPALPVGEIWYGEKNHHAVNFVFARNDETWSIRYIEPQNLRELKLGQADLLSCSFCRV